MEMHKILPKLLCSISDTNSSNLNPQSFLPQPYRTMKIGIPPQDTMIRLLKTWTHTYHFLSIVRKIALLVPTNTTTVKIQSWALNPQVPSLLFSRVTQPQHSWKLTLTLAIKYLCESKLRGVRVNSRWRRITVLIRCIHSHQSTIILKRFNSRSH
jgi:hypothetical protein